ncbi:MAG: putative lipase [Asgard group archaeon]|nr:putative lipase [Asgard group archaeon]
MVVNLHVDHNHDKIEDERQEEELGEEELSHIPIVMTKTQSDNMEHKILYRQTKSVKAGEIERFKINFTPHAEGDEVIMPPTLWVKVKNLEPVSKRAIYLAGPYILYVDCKLLDYDSNTKYFVTADQPVFEPQLLAGQSFYIQLSCHTLKKSYSWIVDVVSQIIFNNTISIDFEIMIGTCKQVLHDASFAEKNILNSDKVGCFNSLLHVDNWDTLDLWNLPVLQPNKPKHLVILTHGLHSNASADMLYLKEQIDRIVDLRKSHDEDIVVKAFFGNIGKTERGIKYLGSRVAEYIIDLITENDLLNDGKVEKISFIGHSLGGCVQTFAIAYLKINFPWFFDKIKPVNFITLASPLLGVVNENPKVVEWVLLAGFVGKSGQELGLKVVENDSKPLLLLLPTGPTHEVLKQFKRRTIYANAINDGIVPLRTSSLLYLDYKGLSEIINSEELAQSDTTDKVPKSVEKANSFLAVQTLLSYFMPQNQSSERYKRFQTQDVQAAATSEGIVHKVIPSSTFLDSAASLVLPPLPSMKYIVDPSSRDNVIIHDKIYYEKDLPVANTEEKLSSFEKLEEEIAREYHKNMGWRKVVVKIKPDAHNNIFVRRRFANAYGWPVIQHLVENHFGQNRSSDLKIPMVATKMNESLSTDSLDRELDLSRIASRDLISKQNDEIDKNTREEETAATTSVGHDWINSEHNGDSLFSLGVTGLLGEVTEMMGDFKDLITKYTINPPALPIIGQIPIPAALMTPTDTTNTTTNTIPENGDLGLTKNGVMNDFI